jgi:hypothetical protein
MYKQIGFLCPSNGISSCLVFLHRYSRIKFTIIVSDNNTTLTVTNNRDLINSHTPTIFDTDIIT